jgi:hypothetical protein
MMFFRGVKHFFRVRKINGINVLVSLFVGVVVMGRENEVILFNGINGFVMVWRMCWRIYDGKV